MTTRWLHTFGILALLSPVLSGCSTERCVDLRHYYDYDHGLPLEAKLVKLFETGTKTRYHVTFKSVHDQTVTALWSLPRGAEQPVPAVIVQHGLGDSKEADYVEAADSVLVAAGFSVLRIDFQYHGERARPGRDVRFDRGLPFTARDAWVQTVFDLRRAVDFLDSRPEIDSSRTGYLGISLGGIVGTVFCGAEPRVEAPILALAGGGLRFLFKEKALSPTLRQMLAPIEPLNFVGWISPRPLLFINATKDEVIPQAATALLYERARKPKTLRWYEGRHRTVPVWRIMRDCAAWYRDVFDQQ